MIETARIKSSTRIPWSAWLYNLFQFSLCLCLIPSYNGYILNLSSLDSPSNSEFSVPASHVPDSGNSCPYSHRLKRVLNLLGTAESCLRQIEKEQLRNKEFFQSDYQNYDGYVFTWEDGRTYNPDYISKLFKKSMKSFGRPEITLYNLRHICASILINKGWDIKKL